VGLAVLPFLACTSCVTYNYWWWGAVEDVVRNAIVRSAGQSAEPDSLIQARSDSTHVPRHDFLLPYSMHGGDNYLAGTGWGDLLTPGVYAATVQFDNGARYRVEAERIGLFGPWRVRFDPMPALDSGSDPVEAEAR